MPDGAVIRAELGSTTALPAARRTGEDETRTREARQEATALPRPKRRGGPALGEGEGMESREILEQSRVLLQAQPRIQQAGPTERRQPDLDKTPTSCPVSALDGAREGHLPGG